MSEDMTGTRGREMDRQQHVEQLMADEGLSWREAWHRTVGIPVGDFGGAATSTDTESQRSSEEYFERAVIAVLAGFLVGVVGLVLLVVGGLLAVGHGMSSAAQNSGGGSVMILGAFGLALLIPGVSWYHLAKWAGKAKPRN